ncbi:alpha/beta fold hydrolase [Lysobacter panacisoli]|uniref:AB hydrolase-1 domain-containing protein n=1 Tax=Lysobacter panacisoli TaxID=1255263 RepID=A0ABP9LK10_9GAMM|nr:alpha/beta fold hydrolase [Lysobacter panacisoli]
MASEAISRAVLVHGAGGGGWEWNVWRRVFAARGIDAVALDLAPAAAGLAATGFGDYLAQVRAALAGLPRPRALVGASLGGLLAAACADEADALVLVNPLPPAPWSASMPARDWPDLVPWRRDARLSSTRRSLADADDATALFAFRRWRDESGAVLRHAQAGLNVAAPSCRTLMLTSDRDEDVPASITLEIAHAWNADVVKLAGSHVGPLLGRDAAPVALRVAGWLAQGRVSRAA